MLATAATTAYDVPNTSTGGTGERLNRLNQLNKSGGRMLMKITDLTKNKPYLIEKLRKVQTKFGPTLIADLDSIQIFLPARFVKMTSEDIDFINENTNISLIYMGTTGKSHDIKFV